MKLLTKNYSNSLKNDENLKNVLTYTVNERVENFFYFLIEKEKKILLEEEDGEINKLIKNNHN